eukprot:8243041-Lingulodinium_polyedra.AAC.1
MLCSNIRKSRGVPHGSEARRKASLLPCDTQCSCIVAESSIRRHSDVIIPEAKPFRKCANVLEVAPSLRRAASDSGGASSEGNSCSSRV